MTTFCSLIFLRVSVEFIIESLLLNKADFHIGFFYLFHSTCTRICYQLKAIERRRRIKRVLFCFFGQETEREGERGFE
jgi:hypothetical protein